MEGASILCAVDMALPRTPDDFHAWVLQKCKELNSSREAKAFARSGAILPKKFYDELFPLALFVRREYQGRTDVSIEPHLGNDNYDATITIHESFGAHTIFVEITCAKDGYDESLRMEVLAREGGVSLTGPITKSGRRGSPDRFVKVTPEAASHLETLERYLRLVEATIEAKSKARYGRSHVLLVAVDDFLPLAQDYDWPLFNERARSWMRSVRLDFGQVVFVGIAGRLLLSYPLPLAATEANAL